MNLLIFVAGTALAIVAARPLSPPLVRRAATFAVFGLMVVAPFISSSTSILFDAEGREVWRYVGDLDWTGAEAAKLLAEAGAPSRH